MKTLYSCLFLSLALVSGTCSAQWLWIDANGTKVYSDQAPPSGIPDKNVLKRPNAQAYTAPTTSPSSSAADKKEGLTAKNAASATSSSQETKQLEAQKALLEKQKAAKAERCKYAKQELAGLRSGARIAVFNDKGEREFMDDKKRAEEVKNKQKVVETDC